MNAFELMVELTKLIDEGHGQRAVFTEGCDCDGDVAAVVLAGVGEGADPSDWILLKRSEESIPREGVLWFGDEADGRAQQEQHRREAAA